ncbi:unnamed protein product [Rotaria sp. Silwood2]|nr:unnamed protein product [Rotaria sp. Silwood2]
MDKPLSRTSSMEMKILTELYEKFHPQELYFLLELNGKWSKYDPNRIQNMTTILRQTFSSQHMESDIEQIITYFNSENCIRLFPPVTVNMVLTQRDQTVHLNPYQSTCPICSSILLAEMADVLSVDIYTLKGKVFFVSCRHSNTTFNMHPIVYVFPNYFRQDKINVFTTKSLQNGDMIYLGGKQVFERSLIENYTCQLLGRASSWQKFVDGLNLDAFNSNLIDTKSEWRKKLAVAFIKYKIVEYDLSIGSPVVSIPCSAVAFDEWLWNGFPRFLSSFIYLWTNHKTLIGACSSSCTQCIIIDGHQKCRRRICRAKHVHLSTEEFTSLKVGCCRTPVLGSNFCHLHQYLENKNDSTPTSPKQRSNKSRMMIQKNIRRKYRQRGFGATNCRTMKERSNRYVERCSRSFGILAVVTNCKIIVSYAEIFRSETLREIISLMCSTIRVLDGINTQAAEQLFSWVKGYANILSSLGWRKMPIYLLLLFHYKNLERVHIRPTHIFNIASSVPNVPTINLAYLAEKQQRLHYEETIKNQTITPITHRDTAPKQIITISNHQLQTNTTCRTSTDLNASYMNTVEQLVLHMEQLAQMEQDKKKRKYNRQQRKNQARRKQRQPTSNTTH